VNPEFKFAAVDEGAIRQLVEVFYGKIKRDPGLGPIFEAAVSRSPGGWAPHLQTMTSFWSSVVLGAGSYRGNPMKAHFRLPHFELALFERWLSLFSETAHELFEPNAAAIFVNRSRVMAAKLREGLEMHRAGKLPE